MEIRHNNPKAIYFHVFIFVVSDLNKGQTELAGQFITHGNNEETDFSTELTDGLA